MELETRLHQMLARRSEIRMAILFGSFAHGRTSPQSDIDLAVLMDAPLYWPRPKWF
jgi:predicted nucleotidyltransferase